MASKLWYEMSEVVLTEERRGMKYVLVFELRGVDYTFTLASKEAIELGEALVVWGEQFEP